MISKIAALAHETGNHSVETRSGITVSLFTGAQSTEIFGGLWDDIVTQFLSSFAKNIIESEMVSFVVGRTRA